MARMIFSEHDDAILKFQIEEGQKIEPEFYAPILPMSLVNGAEGIGTGWSTSIPCFNPLTICENIRRKLKGLDFNRMKPWYRGYTGDIQYKEDGTALTVKGRYEVNLKEE